MFGRGGGRPGGDQREKSANLLQLDLAGPKFRRGPIGKSAALRPEGNPECRLYVGNLDKRVTEGNVMKLFSQIGGLKRCDYMWHTSGPHRGEPRGFAFVEFETREKAGKAQNALNGKVIAGRAMVVHFAEEKVHMQNSAPVEALMMGKLAATGMGSASGGGGSADAGKGQAALPDQNKAALAAALRLKLAQMERDSS